MNLINKKYITSDNSVINYYEINNNNPILLLFMHKEQVHLVI